MSNSIERAAINSSKSYALPRLFMILSMATWMITGCGQKGELYLVDSTAAVTETQSEALDSTSQPQDAAFADLDDDEYQRERYLEQQQIQQAIDEDPNDY